MVRCVNGNASGGMDPKSYAACCSSTVAAKTMTPARPIALAIQKGNAGATLHSSPPMNAAGAMARLRTR